MWRFELESDSPYMLIVATLAVVRGLVQRLMQADADDEDRCKSKLKIRKGKLPS
jgi:hypothetical protein